MFKKLFCLYCIVYFVFVQIFITFEYLFVFNGMCTTSKNKTKNFILMCSVAADNDPCLIPK